MDNRFFLIPFTVIAAAAAMFGLSSPVKAQSIGFESKAAEVLLVEGETGTILYEKNADTPITPASLGKLLTAEYVFNELESGRLSEDTEYKVSEYAWRTGGALSRTSAMFAALNSKIRVIDLLRGVVVQLANDACIVLAEGLAGTEAAFAEKLTARARELGLKTTVMANSNGLPDPRNKTSVRDLVILARHIQSRYPDYYKLYAQPDFEWNKIFQRNRNPLLALNMGVDGFAAGFAETSGYAIVATSKRDDTRLFLAMAGLKSDKERIEESRRILDWAYASFTRRTVFRKSETVAEAAVFGGDKSHVPLEAHEDVDIYIPVNNPDRIRARIVYEWPLKAPVAQNQKIGMMTISLGERPLRDVPIFAASAVGTGTLTSKAFDGLKELLFFWL